MKKKQISNIRNVLYILLAIFLIIVLYFVIPSSQELKRGLFIYVAFFALAFLIFGAILSYLTSKYKIKGKLKWFLIATGHSSAYFILFVILHNMIFALAVLNEANVILSGFFEILHVAFFLLAIFGCPIAFIAGFIGSYVLLRKKK